MRQLSGDVQSRSALRQGGRLMLTELARYWPGAERVTASLKAADRLLRSPDADAGTPVAVQGNGGLADSRGAAADRDGLISDLKANGSFKLLRAGVGGKRPHAHAVGGSASTKDRRARGRGTCLLQHLAQRPPAGCRRSCSVMQAFAALGSGRCGNRNGYLAGRVELPWCNPKTPRTSRERTVTTGCNGS